jgi:hypothetical protein
MGGFQILERLLHDENIYYSKRTDRNNSNVDSGKQLGRNYLQVQGECRIKCTGAN